VRGRRTVRTVLPAPPGLPANGGLNLTRKDRAIAVTRTPAQVKPRALLLQRKTCFA
jgi:hypothetical protein